MQSFLLPRQVDNDYRGHPFALWVFVPLTAITIVRSLIHILRADGGAQSIATIPLDTYPPAAAGAVITIFAIWGVSQLLVGLFYLLVLVRYRALIPLMYVSVFLEYLGRMLVGTWKPLTTLATPPGSSINGVMIFLSLAMLLLCWRRAHQTTESS